jgi:transposase
MFAVEIYAAVRKFVFIEGKSRREAARVFGLTRDTVAKMCRYSAPPGYVRTKPLERPTAPPKQRHTAKRIFERLRDEHGFSGGYTIVKDYVRLARAVAGSVRAARASAWPRAGRFRVAVIGGVRMKLHVFCFDLPHSDACFIKAYAAETTEAFLDGHVSACAFFGGVPMSILYDNLKIAVEKILGDGARKRTQAFTELVSHFLFDDRLGRSGKGNDKRKVEGLVKVMRLNYLTSVPHAASIDALNAKLVEKCLARQKERAGRHERTIGERLIADRAALRELPATPFEACHKCATKVSSQALVRYRTNDYSVPTCYGFRDLLVKAFVDQVVIFCDGALIGRHARSYGCDDFVFDPRHYLALLEQKPGALDQAAPLQGWALPEAPAHLRRLTEARMGKRGKREFIQVLRLSDALAEHIVVAAALEAIRLERSVSTLSNNSRSPGSRSGRRVSIFRPIPICPRRMSPRSRPPIIWRLSRETRHDEHSLRRESNAAKGVARLSSSSAQTSDGLTGI